MIRSFVTSAPASSLHDPAAAEDEHAVADRGELLVVGARADDDDAALLRRGADQLEDLLARADVDALRRLVEQQQPRLGLQPLREQRLLLVAAARARRRAATGRSAARRTRPSARPCVASHPPPVEHDAVEVAVEHGSVRLSATGSEATQPSLGRSAGISASPAAIARRRCSSCGRS